MICGHWWWFWILFFVSMVGAAKESFAIPAFARRYKTACTTCHVLIPKLNKFGKAFKNNGYRIPPKDEAFVKIPDVKLGDEEWKEVWPKGFWPARLPGFPPIALRMDGDFLINPGAEITSDFDIPREIEILAGGNAGSGFSYFFELAFENEEFVLERAFAQFDRIGGNTLFNLKIGRFELASVPFSRFSRRLTAADFITSEFRAVSGGFNFKQRQQGIELWGAKSITDTGGLEYGLGVVNGSGPRRDTNSSKDTYYRLSYKFGGFGVAGSTRLPKSRQLQQTSNWQDDSFKIGAFGYFGEGTFSEKSNTFDRFGFDLDWWYQRLNLFGVFMHGREFKNNLAESSFNAFFVEAEYLLLPWIIALIRYDRVDQDGREIQRIVPGLVLAYRANVRLVNEGEIYLDNSGDSLFRIRLDFLF